MAKLFTRTRSPYWWARYALPDGEDVRRSTKIPNTEELRKQAEIKANDWEVSAWRAWRPGSEKEPLYRFEDLVERYVAEKQLDSAALNNLIRLNEFFFGKVLNTLCAEDIRQFKRKRASTIYKGKPISNGTIRRELSTLSAMINYARIEWDWKLDNPVIGRKPPASRGIIRWLTKEEATRMVHIARNDSKHMHTGDFIELALNTGMRKMELLGLELHRIDLNHHVIHLRPEDQKNSTYSTIPLNQTARAILIKRMTWLKTNYPHSQWLFPTPHGNGKHHLRDIRKGFKLVCEKAGVENFRIHDLRHTFASWLVQHGVPIYEVKELLRHESISTTEKYAHLAPKETARHVDLIEGYSNPAHYPHTGKFSNNVRSIGFDKPMNVGEKIGRDGRI